MIQFRIIDAADQQFAQVINNKRVTFRLRWNLTTRFWSLDIAIDDLPVVTAIRVVLGIDIFEPYGLDIGRLYALPYKSDAVPGREELPSGDVRLYHVTEEEALEFIASGTVPSES